MRCYANSPFAKPDPSCAKGFRENRPGMASSNGRTPQSWEVDSAARPNHNFWGGRSLHSDPLGKAIEPARRPTVGTAKPRQRRNRPQLAHWPRPAPGGPWPLLPITGRASRPASVPARARRLRRRRGCPRCGASRQGGLRPHERACGWSALSPWPRPGGPGQRCGEGVAGVTAGGFGFRSDRSDVRYSIHPPLYEGWQWIAGDVGSKSSHSRTDIRHS